MYSQHSGKVGLKHTQQRDTILRTFLDTRDHLSTEELHHLVKKKDPNIGSYYCLPHAQAFGGNVDSLAKLPSMMV
jgi:hypothetical protein